MGRYSCRGEVGVDFVHEMLFAQCGVRVEVAKAVESQMLHQTARDMSTSTCMRSVPGSNHMSNEHAAEHLQVFAAACRITCTAEMQAVLQVKASKDIVGDDTAARMISFMHDFHIYLKLPL